MRSSCCHRVLTPARCPCRFAGLSCQIFDKATERLLFDLMEAKSRAVVHGDTPKDMVQLDDVSQFRQSLAEVRRVVWLPGSLP